MCEVINIVNEDDELIASISGKDIILRKGYKAIITSEDEKCIISDDEKSE